jgi:uncharacterized membrane protein YidH (DUF202 family)
MSMITSFRPRTRRNVELVLLLLAVAIVLVAYLNVGLAMDRWCGGRSGVSRPRRRRR